MLPHAGGVLLGEHLGRRHQRALVAALHGDEHRADRHEGLARADVALQQAVHRVRPGEVVLDLADRPPLRAGELVRQRRRAGGRSSSPSTVWRIAFDSRSSGRLRITSVVCTRSSSSKASRRRACSFSRDRLGAVDRPERVAAVDQAEAASASPRAAGRRCRAPQHLRSASSTQPAISHVISAAFSLCG